MTTATSADRSSATSRSYGPPPPPPPPPAGTTGREIVDRHTQGSKTDVKAVAADLRNEIRQRPNEATKLMKESLEQVKADDRDELAQEFVRAHSDAELKTLGQTAAGKGALALSVNELSKGNVHKDEADDARRVGTALGTEVDIKVNSGWSWERVSGAVHTVLDVAGFIPGLGAIPDLINAGIYAAEGDLKNAALSATAAVPVAGDAIKGGTMAVKAGRQIAKHGDEVIDVGKQVVKHGDEAVDAGKTVVKKNADDAAAGGAATRQADDAAASAAQRTRSFSNVDDFNRAANSATPNTTYQYGSYKWTTDSQGRVARAEGQVDLTAHGRQTTDKVTTTSIGKSDNAASGDVGFHLIGDQFNGPINRLNVVPGNGVSAGDLKSLNLSGYKRWENEVAGLASKGKVEVRIEPQYTAKNLTDRPDAFRASYRTEGGEWVTSLFRNRAGG